MTEPEAGAYENKDRNDGHDSVSHTPYSTPAIALSQPDVACDIMEIS